MTSTLPLSDSSAVLCERVGCTRECTQVHDGQAVCTRHGVSAKREKADSHSLYCMCSRCSPDLDDEPNLDGYYVGIGNAEY
jgi:hypothetical protein